MGNEADKFNYFFLNRKIHYYNDDDKNIIKSLLIKSEIFKYDAPDIIVVNSDTILLIEHFEIDASKHKKGKGNLDKVERHKRKLKFDAYTKNNNSKSISLSMKVECKYSKSNYLHNLRRLFNEHYEKIDQYLLNVKSEPNTDNKKKIKVAFFIEDTNPLGSYYLDDGFPKSIVLFLMNEFIEIIKESSKLDYIFFSNYNNTNHCVHFMSINEKTIEILKRKSININDNDFFCFNPIEVAHREIIE